MSEDILRQAELRHQRRPRSRQNEEILPLDTEKLKLTNGPKDRLTADVHGLSSLPPIKNQGQQRSNRSSSPYAPSQPIGGLSSPTYTPHNYLDPNQEDGKLSRRRSKSENYDASCKDDDKIEASTSGHLDRPRTPRRGLATPMDTGDANIEKIGTKIKVCLPFIKCKVYDKELKALVNTLSEISTISKRLIADENRRTQSRLPPKHIKIDDTEVPVNFIIDDGAIHDLVLGLDFLTENKCSLNFGTKMLEVAGVSTRFLSEHDLPLKFRNWKGLASSI